MSTTDEDRQRLLSPEEMAAMADDDYNPDEDNAAALRELGRGDVTDDDGADDDKDGDDPEGDDDKDGATKDDGKKPADADDTKKPDADADAGKAAEQDDTAGKTAPAAPAQQPQGYSVELPKDYDDQIKANREAMAEARKKFNDGELDQAEYDKVVDELQDKRDELRDLKTRATIAAEMSQQNAQAAWVATINSFLDDAAAKPELGLIDYRKDTAKQADLDGFVKALANVAGNENKPQRWFLEEAHKRVVALHGVPTTKKPADPERKPKTEGVVQNLADVPGGTGDADPVSNEFAELDKLSGGDYEAALARMRATSPEKYARYMRA